MTHATPYRLSTRLGANRAAARKNLVAFITAGDPDEAATVDYMHAMVAAGVDVIELGVPFSDPMADGPVIQRASERAVARGVSLRGVLQMVADFRARNSDTPVVLMGYANPIECMGQEAFIAEATACGVDGVLVVDYPPEESEDFARNARAAGMDVIYLVAPTTTDARMRSTAAVASGFIYYVSLKGATGSAALDVAEVGERVAHLRGFTDLPIHVGFGISDAARARAVAQVADGVIIGSRLIVLIEEALAAGEDAAAALQNWLAEVRAALDEVTT